MKKPSSILSAALLVALSASAQTGDREGETQVAQIPADTIPPAPPAAPGDALKTFTLQGDFEIQLVAAEPMVVNPVMVRWDASGRLWVMEMRSFMPKSDGSGEVQKISRVSILHDDNGDGRADRKTVFLDNLMMPRAMAFTQNGVLICEPPVLYHYPILEGDKPGKRVVVDAEYAPRAAPVDGKLNVEHAVNGLTRGLDNWFYNAKSTSRYRFVDDEWKKENTYFKGQWGICQDNYGRLIFNSNSDHFRVEHIPPPTCSAIPFIAVRRVQHSTPAESDRVAGTHDTRRQSRLPSRLPARKWNDEAIHRCEQSGHLSGHTFPAGISWRCICSGTLRQSLAPR